MSEMAAHGVFVAHEVFGQEAVALLASAQIVGFAFEVADHGGDPLEAGVAVIHRAAVFVGDALDGLGGDDGLDDVALVIEATPGSR